VDKLGRRQVEIDAAERRKAPADCLRQVRLRRVAIARHGVAQDRPRFGFYRSAMPHRAHAQRSLTLTLASTLRMVSVAIEIPSCGVLLHSQKLAVFNVYDL
jgi:hypothetical protein